ncbi:hypothetical protein C8A05DRAFT_32875 [Staphylotrichum tortipilum]|uniref:Uncharacterized protein n=1 Tax=Staphylotrichum tortipilum TaxID=2831512 RepID=A0AAN6MLZ8_9PEZI|nr:hypothetical protein C8A05DRAFT_32875 [Staphylotrichum longicolle]
MVGCLQALGLCRRKPKVNEAPVGEKTPHRPATEGSSEATLSDPEKPPLKEEAVDGQNHGAKSKEEQVDDPDEEAARRKRAEEEEQERLDFFQMM